MYIPNVLTLIVFLKFFIDFEQKNQSADSKKACTITQRAKSEYILILTRGILFCLDISDQGYRLTFFRQEQAGPLKQNDWGPGPKLRGPGFSGICFTHIEVRDPQICIPLIIYHINP